MSSCTYICVYIFSLPPSAAHKLLLVAIWNDYIINKKQYMNQNVILAGGPNLKLTAVKGIHVHSLYAKNKANKSILF